MLHDVHLELNYFPTCLRQRQIIWAKHMHSHHEHSCHVRGPISCEVSMAGLIEESLETCTSQDRIASVRYTRSPVGTPPNCISFDQYSISNE